MSYEPTVHTSQMAMLRHLLMQPSATFAQLQHMAGLESDAANFHLKQLVQVGYVEKADGTYRLAVAGKEFANRMDTDERVIEKQPKLSVALIIDRGDGAYLGQQRLKHPYFGFWGRPTGKVRWGEQLLEAAARELREETGLTADLRVAGFYHKMDYAADTGAMLEDKLFCVVHGTNPRGELKREIEGHRNEWLDDVILMAKDKVFASVPEITAMARTGMTNFLEQRYDYRPDQY